MGTKDIILSTKHLSSSLNEKLLVIVINTIPSQRFVIFKESTRRIAIITTAKILCGFV